MKVLTWNVHGFKGLSDEALARIIEAIASEGPDIVTLQEVHHAVVEKLTLGLKDQGLSNCAYSRDSSADPKPVAKHGLLIAARGRVVKRASPWIATLPFPELAIHADVQTNDGPVEVISVHVPNGSGNGRDKKVQALHAIGDALRVPRSTPRILTGDFNEPDRFEGGKMKAFGDDDWQDAVSFLFEPRKHDLRLAWHELNGDDPPPVTWVHSSGTERRFDHIFVSEDLRVAAMHYCHDWRTEQRSDHSAAVVTVGPI